MCIACKRLELIILQLQQHSDCIAATTKFRLRYDSELCTEFRL